MMGYSWCVYIERVLLGRNRVREICTCTSKISSIMSQKTEHLGGEVADLEEGLGEEATDGVEPAADFGYHVWGLSPHGFMEAGRGWRKQVL